MYLFINFLIFALMYHSVFLWGPAPQWGMTPRSLTCLVFFLLVFSHLINVILVLSLPIRMSSTPPPSHRLRSFLHWTKTPTHPMPPLRPPPSLLSLPLTTTPWAVMGNPWKSLSDEMKVEVFSSYPFVFLALKCHSYLSVVEPMIFMWISSNTSHLAIKGSLDLPSRRSNWIPSLPLEERHLQRYRKRVSWSH